MTPETPEQLTLVEELSPALVAVIRKAVRRKREAALEYLATTRPTDANHALQILLTTQAKLDEWNGLLENPEAYFTPEPAA